MEINATLVRNFKFNSFDMFVCILQRTVSDVSISCDCRGA